MTEKLLIVWVWGTRARERKSSKWQSLFLVKNMSVKNTSRRRRSCSAWLCRLCIRRRRRSRPTGWAASAAAAGGSFLTVIWASFSSMQERGGRRKRRREREKKVLIKEEKKKKRIQREEISGCMGSLLLAGGAVVRKKVTSLYFRVSFPLLAVVQIFFRDGVFPSPSGPTSIIVYKFIHPNLETSVNLAVRMFVWCWL